MLIIFDCDGVLVDSERLASEIFSQCLKENGIQLSAEECFRWFQGRSLDDCYRILRDKMADNLPEDFNEQLIVATHNGFGGSLKAVSGVREVLEALVKSNFPFCVASNGGHKKIKHSLSITGMLDFFPDRFSVEDVAYGKPKPDLFLFAAKQMGYLPSETIVIEDSLSGYQAAMSANMRCLVFFENGRPAFECEEYFSEMRQLKVLLGIT